MPNDKELRKFGLVLGCLTGLVFGVLLPWLSDSQFPIWPWALAAALVLSGFVAPALLRLIYRFWSFVGHILGFVNTRIILGVIFYLVVTPFGFIKRLRGYDPMCLIRDKKASTYRKLVEYRAAKHMEDCF